MSEKSRTYLDAAKHHLLSASTAFHRVANGELSVEDHKAMKVAMEMNATLATAYAAVATAQSAEDAS